MQIPEVLALDIFISTGFDYLTAHNPHIVCDIDSVVLTLTLSPGIFPLWENPEILSLKDKHTIVVLLAYILYILYNSKERKMDLMVLMLQILLKKNGPKIITKKMIWITSKYNYHGFNGVLRIVAISNFTYKELWWLLLVLLSYCGSLWVIVGYCISDAK